MKRKGLRFLIFAVILILCLSVVASAQEQTAQALTAKRNSDDNIYSKNAETGYAVRIVDEEELLSLTEIMRLSMELESFTEYGDAIFWSCSVSDEEQQEQLDLWQDEDDGSVRSTCVIVINYETGYVHISTSGRIYRSVQGDDLENVSDIVTGEVNKGAYLSAAERGFRQVMYLITGVMPAEPATEAPYTEKQPSAMEGLRYTNPDTGYEVMILDDCDLLSDEKEAKLVEDMKPITEFGHIMFWSTDINASDAEYQAQEKRASYYDRQSAGIFVVNMANRMVTFHTDGAMNAAIDASHARSITDNVSGYASRGDYYGCAKETFNEVNKLLHGQAIAEPMKYISYVIISLMLAFVIVVGLAFGKRFNTLIKKNKHQAKIFGTGTLLASEPVIVKKSSETRAWVLVIMVFIESLFEGGISGGGGSSGGGSGGGGSRGGGSGGSSRF